MVGPPVEYSNMESKVLRPPPMLGEHTEEVLMELLEYDLAKIATLRSQRIIQ